MAFAGYSPSTRGISAADRQTPPHLSDGGAARGTRQLLFCTTHRRFRCLPSRCEVGAMWRRGLGAMATLAGGWASARRTPCLPF